MATYGTDVAHTYVADEPRRLSQDGIALLHRWGPLDGTQRRRGAQMQALMVHPHAAELGDVGQANQVSWLDKTLPEQNHEHGPAGDETSIVAMLGGQVDRLTNCRG